MKRLRRRQLQKFFRRATVLLVLLCLIISSSAAWACPTCKDGLAENDPASQAMAAGYFYSILFMMAMPFVIIGTFGSFAYFSIRRARGAQVLSPERTESSSISFKRLATETTEISERM